MPHTASERMGRGGEVVVVSNDTVVLSTVAGASRTLGREHVRVHDLDELLARIDDALPRIVVVDREDPGAKEVLDRLAQRDDRTRISVVLVVREAHNVPIPGADVIATEAVLADALGLADRGANDHRAVAIESLLAVSVLNGELDDALKDAADLIAEGFHVDRCLISIRGDSTGVAAVGERTWDSLAWSRTAEHCRTAVASKATLITSSGTAACESYLAVPLATPQGSHGFVGLVVEHARIFPGNHGVALSTIAARLGAELSWRAVHHRTSDELERLSNSAGIDRLLGVWNQVAMNDLAAMQVSAARRSNLPLTVAIIDVDDLQGVNNRHGLDIGDVLLFDRVLGQRDYGVAFNPIAVTALTELEQLHRGGTDIEPDEGRCGPIEKLKHDGFP